MKVGISHIIILILITTFVVYPTGKTFGQDAVFSNINLDDTYLNPANSFNAFTTESIASFDLQFRDQWSAITNNNTYATIKLQGDVNIYKTDSDSWNGGLVFLSDRSNEGFLKQTSVRFIMAYTRRLTGRSFRNEGSHFLSAGFSFGLAQTNVDYGALWFGRQYDTNLLTINTTLETGEIFNTDPVSYNDMNFGLKWLYFLDDESIFTAALGVDHLNGPSISNINQAVALDKRFTLQLSASLSIDESLSHEPHFTLINQGPFIQIVPGYKLSLGLDNLESDFAISLGLAARVVNSINGILMDAALINIGLSGRNWNMNFNFDLTTSDIKNFANGNGAIELTLGYMILKK
jgi:type IX secretion system PorP/SprF family membrane protein